MPVQAQAPATKESAKEPQRSVEAATTTEAGGIATASSLLGSEAADGRTLERHATALADPRLTGPTSAGQRAMLMRQLQRGYGNAHVSRVVARVRQGGTGSSAVVQRDCPPAAVERPPLAPEQDAGFKATKAKVVQVATKEKEHPPAKIKADEAQAAAAGPPNEVASQAAAGQVDKMGQQQPGVFDKKAFVEAVHKAIEAAAPKNLDEADKYKSSGKAAEVKGQVVGQVKSGKEAAEKDIKQTAQAAPDAAGAKAKTVAPMKPEAAGAAPGPVGAASAMPSPKPADETDLRHEPCETKDAMKDAGVSEQQLKKSNEPQFNDALAAKKEADAHSASAPPAYRADEKSTLGQSKTDATGTAAVQAGAMHGVRTGALAHVTGQKAAAKAKDEADRAKVAADLEAIYAKTKADVTTILEGLEGKVTTAFDAGEKSAREAMEAHIDDKTTDFKLRRYLMQPGGTLLWVKDQFSKPPELDAIVDAGVKLFLGRMDAVINQVADIVAAELTAAKNRIAQGRDEVKKHVAALPKNLQKIGQEAAAALTEKFDGLDQEVNSKRDELVASLAQKYVTARDAANERAKELRAANEGLWAKAKDAVNGVIETIKNLKAMLLGVLAKAAGVIDTIIEDPIKFLGNLVSAIKMGLNQFVGNIVSHLKKGLLGWLFGTLAEAGIQLPESFDVKGILSLVLQILGLTYSNIRSRAVKIVGEKTVAALEKTVEIFTILVKEGPAGLWKFIQDKLSSLKEQVMESIKDFVITKVITAGITWLISLLNPASAFIKACKMIYDVVMFFVERGSQIMGLVNAVLDGVSAIASGALGGAANLVESALGKALPVAISFLASLLGLGGIAEKIKSVIEKIQKPINSMIDKLIGGVLKVAKKVGGAIKGLFGKKGSKDGDSDQSAKVKARAHEELGKRTKSPFKTLADLNAVVAAVRQQLTPEGLKELSIKEKSGKAGQFDIIARAGGEKVDDAEVAEGNKVKVKEEVEKASAPEPQMQEAGPDAETPEQTAEKLAEERKKLGHSSLFRGDEDYRSGPIGRPLGSEAADAADVQDPVHHVLTKRTDETSRYASFSTVMSTPGGGGPKKFASKNRIVKVAWEALVELEKQGIIKIYTPDDVAALISRHPKKKIAKQANDVKAAMLRNAEILIEGQIPEEYIAKTA